MAAERPLCPKDGCTATSGCIQPIRSDGGRSSITVRPSASPSSPTTATAPASASASTSASSARRSAGFSRWGGGCRSRGFVCCVLFRSSLCGHITGTVLRFAALGVAGSVSSASPTSPSLLGPSVPTALSCFSYLGLRPSALGHAYKVMWAN